SRTHTGSSASQRLRSLLVTGEISTTLVILVGAGLLGRSFLRLVSTSPGFRQENLITMEFSLPIPQGQEGMDGAAIARQTYLLDDIVARLGTIPGTAGVGLAGALPVAAGDNLADGLFLILNGQRPPANFDKFGRMAQHRSQTGVAEYAVASQGYFSTLGIPLIRGRMFGEQDDVDSPHVAVIQRIFGTQTLAHSGPDRANDRIRQYGRKPEASHHRWHCRRCPSERPRPAAESHHLCRLPPARNGR
ncbi:MAG: hypothetical protein WA510_11900, partial [Acidobacteriaceae bacterium]